MQSGSTIKLLTRTATPQHRHFCPAIFISWLIFARPRIRASTANAGLVTYREKTDRTEARLQNNNTVEIDLVCCGRQFKNRLALNMHKVRKHSDRNWSGKPLKNRKPTREQIQKRKSNLRYREKQLTQALPSFGPAAEAIIMAANVIRAVAIGMKIQ